ncbi:hypothetical protein [Streptomyces sp. NPDC091212]|uniref:hypothetical protein n=1 Tax=Streptomyces sp. NPDC091212 TaxID=3155191 RepID=UPI003436DDE3
MTTAQHLAAIELLRAAAFPAVRGPTGPGTGGPGWALVELAGGADTEQCGAEHTALVDLLTVRLGEPDVLSLWSLQARVTGGEEIPEPWRELSSGPRWLHLWRIGGRWLAVGLADGAGIGSAEGADGPGCRLLAAVTETDPP